MYPPDLHFNFPSGPVFSGPSNNSPPKTLNRSELSQWVEHVTKQLIEDPPENDFQDQISFYEESSSLLTDLSTRPAKVPRKGPNDSPGSILSGQENLSDLEHSKKSAAEEEAEPGMNLLSLLFECAVAISVDNLGEAQKTLLELNQMASPYSGSCAERVVAYFAKSMLSRVISSWIGVSAPLINVRSAQNAFQLFNTVAPYVKFAHFTSNQAILEAIHGHDRVHIIDLDVMQGLQWPALFHILATRPEGPPRVRMTGLGSPIEILTETGKQLSNFARRLGLCFEYHPVDKKFGDITDPSALHVRRGETLAVHWVQHSLYDPTGPDRKTMALLRGLGPKVVTLVEQEISHGGSFLDRFVGSLHYYSTVFDSLGAFMGTDDPNRQRIEQGLLHREINNVLAIGGPARSGEDKFRHWRGELSRSGFVQVPMSSNSMAQAQLILNMFPVLVNGYSLVQGDGTLRLGWKETSLYTASSWTTSPASFNHLR